jgi:hypothetical protein
MSSNLPDCTVRAAAAVAAMAAMAAVAAMGGHVQIRSHPHAAHLIRGYVVVHCTLLITYLFIYFIYLFYLLHLTMPLSDCL